MPNFKLEMYREVITHDAYEVEVEADTQEEAEAKAERMASDMNSDCPDGVTETGYVECQDWQVRRVSPAKGEAIAA